MNTSPLPRRPTAEEWYRTTSAIPDAPQPPKPPPPRPQPTPLETRQDRQNLPRRSQLRLGRPSYWLFIFLITFLVFVLPAMTNGGNHQLESLTWGGVWLLFTMLCLPVAALRSRDMGLPWWVCFTAIIPVVGLIAFLWFGFAPKAEKPKIGELFRKLIASTQSNQAPDTGSQLHPHVNESLRRWKKPLLIGAAAIALVGAAAIAIPVSLPDDNPVNRASTAKCDNRLRERLDSPEVTSSQIANAAITHIQANRPNQCKPSAWNPAVRDVAKDHVGNIDVKFWTINTIRRGAAVTMPYSGMPRWVYLAEKRQWYSSELDDPSVLATPPTVSNQSAPAPTTGLPYSNTSPGISLDVGHGPNQLMPGTYEYRRDNGDIQVEGQRCYIWLEAPTRQTGKSFTLPYGETFNVTISSEQHGYLTTRFGGINGCDGELYRTGE